MFLIHTHTSERFPSFPLPDICTRHQRHLFHLCLYLFIYRLRRGETRGEWRMLVFRSPSSQAFPLFETSNTSEGFIATVNLDSGRPPCFRISNSFSRRLSPWPLFSTSFPPPPPPFRSFLLFPPATPLQSSPRLSYRRPPATLSHLPLILHPRFSRFCRRLSNLRPPSPLSVSLFAVTLSLSLLLADSSLLSSSRLLRGKSPCCATEVTSRRLCAYSGFEVRLYYCFQQRHTWFPSYSALLPLCPPSSLCLSYSGDGTTSMDSWIEGLATKGIF